MNRPLIITIGIVIIGLVVSVWVYLLLYGTPQAPREVFTNFGFLTPISPEPFESVEEQEQQGVSDLALEGRLEQLTTRSVAGHTFLIAPDGIRIRYAEMGTGHIYEIDLTRSEETQISITTVPETAKAVFSPNGESVALIRYQQSEESATIGKVDDESKELLELSSLPKGVANIAFRNDNTVYYTTNTSSHTIGSYYDIEFNTSTEVFRIPLHDVLMRWGSESNTYFAITKPTPLLTGAMYILQNGSLTPVGQTGNGLVGFANTSAIVTTKIEDAVYASYSQSAQGNLRQTSVLIPEKCAFDALAPTEMWCGIPNDVVDASYIEEWYKGEHTSIDSLWFIDLHDQTSRRVLNLKDSANKDMDVFHLKADVTGTHLSFINKIDQSLWLYKIGDYQ